MPSKKKMFFLCLYKKIQINKEVYKKCEVEIIDKGRYFWVNRNDLEVESDVANWAQTCDYGNPGKQKYRQELTSHAEYQQCSVFVRNDLVEKKLKAAQNHQKDF